MPGTLTMERAGMAAKKRTEKAGYASVKLPSDVMETARIVAAYKGVTIAEMLGDLLRPVLAKMEREEAAKRAKASN
jgi:hypothetical protein